MTYEAELVTDYRAIRNRLVGVLPAKPPTRKSRPLEPPDIDEALVILPKPSKAELDAIFEEDMEWRQGVKQILVRYGENLRRLVSNNRDRHIVECRTDVANYLRARGWSYPRIGEFMHRDHTSILNLVSPDLIRSLRRQAAKKALR